MAAWVYSDVDTGDVDQIISFRKTEKRV
jgi:hypothetical protein